MFQKDPASVFGENGIVEVDHESGEVRRSIPEARKFYLSFLETDIYRKCVEAGMLPKYKKSEHTTPGHYWLDVEHIPFVTRPNEWCGTQIVDAMRMMGRLQYALMNQAGYYIRYPHLGNVTFNPRPVMLDIGDIRKQIEGRESILIKDGEAKADLGAKVKNWPQTLRLLNALEASSKSNLDIAKEAIAIYDKMVPNNRTGPWSDYNTIKLPPAGVDFATNFEVHKQKGKVIYDVLKERRPKTLIDFGSHRGYYSFMGSQLGSRVLGMELCEDAVANAYTLAKKRGDDCSFVTVNLLNLPKPMGIGGGYRPIGERIKAEAGIVPAVLHHLSKDAKFDKTAAMFNTFVKDWLLIEFPPSTDVHVKTWNMPAWYNVDEFRKEYGKYWSKFSIFPSYPNPRIWILCER